MGLKPGHKKHPDGSITFNVKGKQLNAAVVDAMAAASKNPNVRAVISDPGMDPLHPPKGAVSWKIVIIDSTKVTDHDLKTKDAEDYPDALTFTYVTVKGLEGAIGAARVLHRKSRYGQHEPQMAPHPSKPKIVLVV